MNISVFGLGYVGCVGVACLARHGHRMIGVDPQHSKVQFISEGRPTIIEKDIEAVLSAAHAAGRVRATTDPAAAVRQTDVSFICVGTPPTSTGHLELSAVFRVAEDIGRALKAKSSPHVVAVRSTVMPGTVQKIEAKIAAISGRAAGVDFAVVSNPEFLREGTSVEDFDHPAFTLVGSDSAMATDIMREVYAHLEAPFIVVPPPVAELMKYVSNSFHALKIAFANEVGNICDALHLDPQQVMEVFCRDAKLNVSKAYLRPGFAYGGSCLPKDLCALQTIAHDHYLQCSLLNSIAQSNEHQKEIALRRIESFHCRKIGFLGLSFKAGTDDLRESPIVDVIERLLGRGYDVQVYDQHVHVSRLVGANRDYILQKIPFISRFISANLEAVLAHAELVVVVNNEPGFAEALRQLARGKMVYDLGRIGVPQTPPPRLYAEEPLAPPALAPAGAGFLG